MANNTTRLSDLPMASEHITYQIQGQGQGQVQAPTNFQMQGGGRPDQALFDRIPTMQGRPLDEDGLHKGGDGLANSMIQQQHLPNNYMPMDIHPNPYGNGIPSVDSIPFPQYTKQESNNNRHQEHHGGHGHGTPPPIMQNQQTTLLPEIFPEEIQRLPSRDIPMDTVRYSHDEAIQANYIPPPPPSKTKRVEQYIQEYDDMESAKIQQHTSTKKQLNWYESMFHHYQHFLFLCILYFIFQMHIISHLMSTYLVKWTWLYQSDGQLSVYGMASKSVIFTAIYVSFITILDVI
jgi:hypothetical protein